MKRTLIGKKGNLFLYLLLSLFITSTVYSKEKREETLDLLLQNIRIEEHKQFNGNILRSLHPTSLLKALQMAEPSLILSDNNETEGDNPSLQSVNLDLGIAALLPLNKRSLSLQPLLVIDGYIANIKYLQDFDINRVDKVVILDKANTLALYGVKGGNGVIYIKTKGLKNIGLNVFYRGDLSVSFADLSSYSLYSTQEKLSLENSLGYYNNSQLLFQERSESENSADFWLNKGVRPGILNRHSLEVEGGDDLVKFRISLLAKPADSGVMDGVNNNSYGVGANLEYKSQKFLISNDLRVDLINSKFMPNICLLDYAMINPYNAEKNSAGFLEPILGEGSFNWQFSPSYEGDINSFIKTNRKYITNNLLMKYNFHKYFSLQGSFTFHKNFDKRDQFISHLSKLYYDVPDEMIPFRGRYDIVRANQTTFEEKLLLGFDWSRNKHMVNVIAGIALYNTKLYSDNYAAIGFPNTSMSYISFANRYAFDSKPGGKESYDRVVSEYVSGYYSFDNRYIAELNARVDQTSALHKSDRSFLSYSASLSWIVSNEKWFANNLVTKFNITSSIGKTGYIDFNYSDVNTMYNYLIDEPYLDFSASSPIGLLSLNRISVGNPALKPRALEGFNIRADLTIANIIDMWFSYNHTLSTDMLSVEKIAPIKGYEEQYINGGEILNKSLRLGMNINLLNTEESKINVIVNMLKNDNEVKSVVGYHKESYNKHIRENSQQLYTQGIMPIIINEGYSLDAIYAYRDGGSDLEYIANSLPSLFGNFSILVSYKKLSAGVMFNYTLGSSIYNMTKDYRMANGDPKYNLPKGSKEYFESGGNKVHSATFVETNNTLKLSSINLSYRVNQKVSAGIVVNNLFTYTSAIYERGWVYPYTKTFNFFIKANF